MEGYNVANRCAGKQLAANYGRLVTVIVSPSVGAQGEQIFVTTDGVPVFLSVPAGERFETQYAQIEAKVASVNPLHLECRSVNLIYDVFDVDNYNKAVDLMTGKYSYLFA
eukprot:gene6188-4446_t